MLETIKHRADAAAAVAESDSQLGQPLQHARADERGHAQRGIHGDADDGPEHLVADQAAFDRRPHAMHEHRQVQLVQRREHFGKARIGWRDAVDVAADLDARKPERLDALRLGNRQAHIVHRQATERGEALGMRLDHPRHGVVGMAAHDLGCSGLEPVAEQFGQRRQHLHGDAMLVHEVDAALGEPAAVIELARHRPGDEGGVTAIAVHLRPQLELAAGRVGRQVGRNDVAMDVDAAGVMMMLVIVIVSHGPDSLLREFNFRSAADDDGHAPQME